MLMRVKDPENELPLVGAVWDQKKKKQRVEWQQDWNAQLPSGAMGMHKGWVGFGTGQDGGKYVENGWQNSWNSGTSGGDYGRSVKQSWSDQPSGTAMDKWSWGNGGAQGWGSWGSDYGRNGGFSTNSDGDDAWKKWGSNSGSGAHNKKHGYVSWGNVMTRDNRAGMVMKRADGKVGRAVQVVATGIAGNQASHSRLKQKPVRPYHLILNAYPKHKI
ncbi:unnamed protein product [Gongylonema pulchrum]|uniref:G-patch domain-containing protein n=1 Tax=Gongylonema pulchrum TaxID=637853 RepID=A0A183CYJ8_9BILA|nr:unnamed protein product [Gongylonema pulchrum]